MQMPSMFTLSPPWLVAIGIFATALAQALLKQSAQHAVPSTAWLGFMAAAAGSYALSFLLYALVLKTYALSKVYPVMTLAQIGLVTAWGLFTGEAVGLRHAAGLALAAVAIWLLLA